MVQVQMWCLIKGSSVSHFPLATSRTISKAERRSQAPYTRCNILSQLCLSFLFYMHLSISTMQLTLPKWWVGFPWSQQLQIPHKKKNQSIITRCIIDCFNMVSTRSTGNRYMNMKMTETKTCRLSLFLENNILRVFQLNILEYQSKSWNFGCESRFIVPVQNAWPWANFMKL